MFKRSFLLIPAVLGLVALAGCSGSSSSGASTAYAGQYDGSINIVLRGFGETLTQTYPYRVTVGVDGLVIAGNPNGAAEGQCDFGTKPTYLTGNSISVSASGSCYVAGIGTCSVSASQQINFSSGAASTAGAFVFNCPQGRVDAQLSGYLKKTV